MKNPRNSDLLGIARTLRKNMTKEEKHLWYDFLVKQSYRFRRQEIIGDYVADFYCESLRLVIEVDGIQHEIPENIEKDLMRTEYLQSLGITVIRFSNDQVNHAFHRVMEQINETVYALALKQ